VFVSRSEKLSYYQSVVPISPGLFSSLVIAVRVSAGVSSLTYGDFVAASTRSL
jgi:hypothetical protein